MNRTDKITKVMNYLINIRHFANSVSKEVKVDFPKSDINCSEAFYLILLNENSGGLTMSELSAFAKVDKSLTTRIIKKLLDKGYIYKNTDDLSTRNYKIKLTDLGIDRANDIDGVLITKYDSFVKKYTKEELKRLEDAFELILDKFDEKI